MKKTLLFLFLISGSCLYTSAQQDPHSQTAKALQPQVRGDGACSGKLSIICSGEITTPTADLKWKPGLTHKTEEHEAKAPDQDLIDRIKAEKTKLKFAGQSKQLINNDNNSILTTTPVVGVNYAGNTNNGWSPLDNNIAISNGGIIVSVSNSTLEVDDSTGTNFYFNTILTLINDTSISSVCDPVVIYDKGADRFIFYCQECSGTSAGSRMLVLFSKTNNPATGGWWYYKLPGNVLNDASWADYPKIAISNNEVYISSNLFFDSGGFNQAILMQIQKAAGYAGGTLVYQHWSGITGSPFTLLPVSDGQASAYGPGCWMVSTKGAGSTIVHLYHLTDDMTGSPVINYYPITVPAFSPAGYAQQLGSTVNLNNNDCRSLSGFYLNGFIHFVHMTDGGAGWNYICYYRVDVNNQTAVSSRYGSQTSDICYPAIASFATSLTDNNVMIGYGNSNSSIYPQVCVINCDNAMSWSPAVVVKNSASFVHYTGNPERWGDYTGMCRRHNSLTPSVWMQGSIGNANNHWDAWNAEIHSNPVVTGIQEPATSVSQLKTYPNPVTDRFMVDFTIDKPEKVAIAVYDLQGRIVKKLYEGLCQAGENNFSFTKSNLSPGTYFLIIRTNTNTVRNEKIIVAD